MTNGKLVVGVFAAYLILLRLVSVDCFIGGVNSKFFILTSNSFTQACSDIGTYYTTMQHQWFGNTISITCVGVSLTNQQKLLKASTPEEAAECISKTFKPEDVDKVVLYVMRTQMIPSEVKMYGKFMTYYPMMVNGMLIAYNFPTIKNTTKTPLTLTQEALWHIVTEDSTTLTQLKQATQNKNTWGTPTPQAGDPPPKLSIIIRPARLFATEILVKYLEDYALTKLGKRLNETAANRAFASEYPQSGALVQYAFDESGAAQNSIVVPPVTSDLINKVPPGIAEPKPAGATRCHVCLASKNGGLSMAGLLAQNPYSLAVMGQEEVETFGLPTALIVNKDEQAVTCDEESTQSAIDHSTGEEGESIINMPGQKTYPLLDYTYIGVSKIQLGSSVDFQPRPLPGCDVLANALHFLNWLIADDNKMSRQILSSNFFLLGPKSRYSKFTEAQRTQRCGAMNMLVQGFIDNLERREALIISLYDPVTYVAVFFGLIVGGLVIYFGGRMLYTHLNRLHRESMEHFSISSKKIRITPVYLSPVDRFKGVVASRKVVDRYIPTASIQCISTGTWGDIEVFLRPCSLVIHRLRHETRLTILEMMEELKHPHIVPFYGMTELQQGRCLVCSFCPFGDLRTLIIAKHYEFSMNTKFSLAGDIADGMAYIHRKGFVHGNLRSCAVYIEADWTARVSDFEYDTLHQVQASFHPTVIQLKQKLNLYQQTSLYPWLYWTSPEILRQGITGREVPPEKSADVYSFGIVCAEIFSMTPAYQTYQELPYKLTPAQILNGILSADMRPREDWKKTATPNCVLRMLEYCWQEDPSNRPGFKVVRDLLRSVKSLRRHVADKIMIAAEKQCEQLDRRLQSVDTKMKRLDDEFHRLSRILLPPAYWRTIYKQKLYTTMTRHELGIIFYCTLVSYDAMISTQRAVRALECVNLLHKGFQNIIEASGRVYRMYRNGIGFVALGNVPYGVKEDPIDSIARLAFDFMTWAWRVKLPANLMDGFQLQVGIHSGPMAAGTLKYSTNHYTPLGKVQKEAWNISRSSAPCRVLISEDFHQNLRQLAQIFIKYRIVPNKDKVFGYKKQTYWLVGMNYYRQQSLLDEMFLLDPENLEASSKLQEIEMKERNEKRGILRNELVKVVSALPFDYQALKAGGQQYVVDVGLKDRDTSNVVEELAPPVIVKEAKSIQLVESYEEPVIILDATIAEAKSTSGSRPTQETQKLIDQENAQKEVKKTSSLTDAELEAKKYEEQAIKHLRHMKKLEHEQTEHTKKEHQHLIQLQHELVKVAQHIDEPAAPTTDLVELEKQMDQEITIRIPVMPVVAHIIGPTEHAPPESHHGEEKDQHGSHHHGHGSSPGGHHAGVRGFAADVSTDDQVPLPTAEQIGVKADVSVGLVPQSALLDSEMALALALSKPVALSPSSETNLGGLQRSLRAAAAEYVPVQPDDAVVLEPDTTPETILVQPIDQAISDNQGIINSLKDDNYGNEEEQNDEEAEHEVLEEGSTAVVGLTTSTAATVKKKKRRKQKKKSKKRDNADPLQAQPNVDEEQK